jgi:hypothetical protein
MLSFSEQPEISNVVEIPLNVHTFVVNARILPPVPAFAPHIVVPTPQAACAKLAGASARNAPNTMDFTIVATAPSHCFDRLS